MGNVDKIPIYGVDMLLGNDLAGEICPALCVKPVVPDEKRNVSTEVSDLYPSVL